MLTYVCGESTQKHAFDNLNLFAPFASNKIQIKPNFEGKVKRVCFSQF